MNGLYCIVDPELTLGRDPVFVAESAIRGGSSVIQLRSRSLPGRLLYDLALRLRELTRRLGTTFIVNDRVDIAAAADADGVHLGQTDLPIEAARRVLSRDAIIGISTHGVEEAKDAQRRGADYIGFGSVFPTVSKPDALIAGVSELRRVRSSVSIPVVAIGGIGEENVHEVIQAGASSAAVISAVCSAVDVQCAARRLRARIDLYRRVS